MVLMRTLAEKGLCEVVGVVANLCPAPSRARLARGTLSLLGLAEVGPVWSQWSQWSHRQGAYLCGASGAIARELTYLPV